MQDKPGQIRDERKQLDKFRMSLANLSAMMMSSALESA